MPEKIESYWASAACLLLTIGALALSLSGNYLFGGRMAMTEAGSHWNGGASLYVDLAFTALCGFLGVAIARRSTWKMRIFLGVMAVLFGAASLYSLIGFQGSERINKVRTEQLAVTTQKSAVDKRNAMAAGAYERNLSWLRSQVANAPTRAEKREANRMLAEATKNAPDMDVAQVSSAMSDPQATVFAEITTLPESWLQIGNVVVVCLLVVLGKGIFSGLFGYYLPRKAEAVAVEVPEIKMEPVAEPQRPRLVPTPEVIEDDKTDDLAAKLEDKVESFMDEIEHRNLRAFFSEAMRPASDSSGILASELHAAYADWAKARGISEKDIPTLAKFGRDCTKLMNAAFPLYRKAGQRGMLYKGWKMKSGEAREAPQARAA
jgi:hypothetical protein